MRTSRMQLFNYLKQINMINNERRQNEASPDNASTIEVYKWFVAKEKAIFTA